MDDTLDALGFGKGRVFSTMDIASGYWHIPIKDRNKEKTAFTTNSGTYQFNVTPFGLTGAPGAFCRAMNNCLREFLFKCALVFVDNIVVWSPDLDSHEQDLANVFSKLMEHGFQLKLSKCSFFQKRIEFLGFIIEDGKISIDKSKLEAIANFAHPTNRQSLQRFLGMVGWY